MKIKGLERRSYQPEVRLNSCALTPPPSGLIAQIGIATHAVDEGCRLKTSQTKFHKTEFKDATDVVERIAQEQITRIVQRHGCREEGNRDPSPNHIHASARVGSRFVPPGVHFCTPGGTFFDPCILLDSGRSGSFGFAAELTVHDGSHRLLNVQLFLLATPGTLVVQAFPEGESQTHSRRIRNHSMMVQAKHLQRDQE